MWHNQEMQNDSRRSSLAPATLVAKSCAMMVWTSPETQHHQRLHQFGSGSVSADDLASFETWPTSSVGVKSLSVSLVLIYLPLGLTFDELKIVLFFCRCSSLSASQSVSQPDKTSLATNKTRDAWKRVGSKLDSVSSSSLDWRRVGARDTRTRMWCISSRHTHRVRDDIRLVSRRHSKRSMFVAQTVMPELPGSIIEKWVMLLAQVQE